MQEPRLYILMRTDMDSMNPGKAMAQAAHAANAFVKDASIREHNQDKLADPVVDQARQWQEETSQGFGTTIVLDVGDEDYMKAIVATAKSEGLIAGVIHDPGYPVKDGSVTHEIPVDTCAYVFMGDDTVEIMEMNLLRLHK